MGGVCQGPPALAPEQLCPWADKRDMKFLLTLSQEESRGVEGLLV